MSCVGEVLFWSAATHKNKFLTNKKGKEDGRRKKKDCSGAAEHAHRREGKLPETTIAIAVYHDLAAAIYRGGDEMECSPPRFVCRGNEDGMKLSPAENRVADGICRGLTEKEIAAEIYRSPQTIHTQMKSIYRKCGVCKDTELLWWMICRRLGLLFDIGQIRRHGVRLFIRLQ